MFINSGVNITGGVTVTGGDTPAESWTYSTISGLTPSSSLSMDRMFYKSSSGVISGFGYNTVSSLAIRLYSSDNGNTWTFNTLSGISGEYRDMGFDESTGNFVSVTGANVTDNDTAVSSDGITYTEYSNNLPTSSFWYGVGGGGGTFLAGVFASNALAVSTDGGVTWSTRTATGVVGTDSICYGNSVWLLTYRSAQPRRSTDNGVTWTTTTTPLDNSFNCKFVNNRFWVNTLTAGTNSLCYSQDNGVTWQQSTLPVSAYWEANTVSYVNGYWFVIGTSGANVYFARSSDGINWTSITPPTELNQATSATSANGVIVLADYRNKGIAGTLVLN